MILREAWLPEHYVKVGDRVRHVGRDPEIPQGHGGTVTAKEASHGDYAVDWDGKVGRGYHKHSDIRPVKKKLSETYFPKGRPPSTGPSLATGLHGPKGFSQVSQEDKSTKKSSTPEQRQKRRAAHWRKTGVSDRTIKWMKDGGYL